MRAPRLTFERARALRGAMTLPEVVLWQALRAGKLAGLRCRRQHPIGPFILDFYCPASRLAVEVDGSAHDVPDQARHDERRTAWLAERGIRVLRFAAADLLKPDMLEGVLLTIAEAAAEGRVAALPRSRGGREPSEPNGG
ncbi:endonuclease domain-containing protein [Enterovirga sp.]|uniref:endonuclease domain-containing protein n=1 Tax=Enterovirga sp. TaxID=2026350 RepID=UPI00260DBD34|nr:endonuclease domain-containing protein [Enterovirga sp.]MDB5592398.1 hypothetical protein [Enterovirga sp.]